MIKNVDFLKTRKSLYFLAFLCFFIGTSNVQAQGPNAPEAAAFEPVDATDMVNLVTGNLSYVLPILNVPSPEGGYPISLSYHAGIAMDQEASWVGLGWNINPGSINRAVNGYPDDWGETNFSEFFYDKGWEEDYYSFSAGVSIGDTFSVGLGLSWGSHQSLGGFVEASMGIGGKDSGVSIGGFIGTNGVGIHGGVNGFSASVSTNGVGVGYSGTKQGSPNLGVNLNYNYSSGLSGGISVSQSKYNADGKLQRGKGTSVGISFSSNGMSANAKVNGYGAGISTASQTIDSGDYDVNVSTTGFRIPAYIFYVGWSHTKIKASLFKHDFLFTSGTLYPVNANTSKLNSVVSFSKEMQENHLMDVNIMQPFRASNVYDDLIDDAKKNDRNNLMLPNYDNYAINAQGLSGTLTPYMPYEMNLSGRGRGEQNNDNEYVTYLNNSYDFYTSIEGTTGVTPNELTRKYFTFSNAYNSFLRLQRTNILPTSSDTANSESLMNGYSTNEALSYNNESSLTSENRKREGNVVTTYTNKEIREGGIFNFIEAREGTTTLNRADTDVFLDEGIGAYQVTTLDGKTYHYSLPVYQFESFYKNFRNEDYNEAGEDENFFEIQKTKPYATHWLLTAITGPDYYDKNDNGRVDEEDYGYWVEFDYGKWSDGYIWQTPNGRYEETTDKEDETKKTYSYSWGRKQIYYLDAIKTRTHTALFVKDLRNDSFSKHKMYDKIYSSETLKEYFKPNDHAYVVLKSDNTTQNQIAQQVFQNDNLDGINKEGWGVVADYLNIGNYGRILGVLGKKTKIVQLNLPKNKLMKLSKIILVNNSYDDNLLRKTNSSYSNMENTGYFYNTVRIGNLPTAYQGKYTYDLKTESGHYFNGEYVYLYFDKPVNREIKIHQHQNILDIQDIEGLNLEQQAVQVIDFEHDYSLVQNAPNAETGRLTLKKVKFKGKGGVQMVPPYKFNYEIGNVYHEDNIDAWGYHKTNPAIWSLNKITTPTGGNINIEYGKDAYVSEAAFSKEKDLSSGITSVTGTSSTIRINFANDAPEASDYFKEGRYYRIWYLYRLPYPNQDILRPYEESYKVNSIGDNWVVFDFQPPGQLCAGDSTCSAQDNIKVYGTINGLAEPVEKGGITTKSITINDGIQDIATTEYVYKRGITSYAPSEEPQGIPYVSELPAPMVLYGEVEMQNKDGKGTYLGSTVYEFETLEPRKEEEGYIFSLGEAFRVKENQNTTFESRKVIANKFTIESKLGNIGRMKSIASYNSEGQLLTKTENVYKTDLDRDGEIGVTQESHKSYKRYEKDDVETFYVSSTSKVNYPSVLEKTVTTQGGFQVTKNFDKHDFLTGQILETSTYASDGVAFKTKGVPAYTISEYAAMGSKIDNPDYKNMLTQSAASYTYLLDSETHEEKIIGAGITTWNDEWIYSNQTLQQSIVDNQWRKHKTYTWKGAVNDNGTYKDYDGEDDGFDWTLRAEQPTTSKWQAVSEITRYDRYSMPVESKDINGNYVATKMGDNHSKIIATANAAYTEMYYSGAEYVHPANASYFDGDIKSFGRVASETAHTGNYIVAIDQGQNAFEVTVPANAARTYPKNLFRASVWVRTTQKEQVKIKINGSVENFNTNEAVVAGEWTLLQRALGIQSSQTTVAITSASGTVELDDFRLHPITSSMMSYVYNEFDELTFITGANGLSTQYIYDAVGRLKEIKPEVITNEAAGIEGGFEKTVEYNYNYKYATLADTNGDGVIDDAEGYDPIRIYINRNSSTTTAAVTVNVTGGSGNFKYKFARGIVSGSTAASQAANLVYGAYSENNTTTASLPCNPNADNEYEAYVVRVMVYDNETGKTQESLDYFSKSCSDGSGGPDGETPQ